MGDRFAINDLNGRKCRIISITGRNDLSGVTLLGNDVWLEDLETGEDYYVYDWEMTEILDVPK